MPDAMISPLRVMALTFPAINTCPGVVLAWSFPAPVQVLGLSHAWNKKNGATDTPRSRSAQLSSNDNDKWNIMTRRLLTASSEGGGVG